MEPASEHARLRAADAHDDDLAGLLRDVQPAVRAEGHRGRARQPGRVALRRVAGGDAQLGRRAQQAGARALACESQKSGEKYPQGVS